MRSKLNRRTFIERLSVASGAVFALPWLSAASKHNQLKEENVNNPIKQIKPLGFQWETQDPFLFCVHHEDFFPKGNDLMGPDQTHFNGRHMGDDFIIKDGFRMYHGKTVPGFPGHPHRGFETITVVRKGLVDHADSLGAAGRYGDGDVQWMTSGKGVQHSEMFPLLSKEEENPMELFQIWLNLPKKDKMVEPHFKMLWKDAIPNITLTDEAGKTATVELIAGTWGESVASAPPPNSWAAVKENEVMIVNIKMQPEAQVVLPKASTGVNRTLYFYEGDQLTISDHTISSYSGVDLVADQEVILQAGAAPASILILQGKPIAEPVMQYGPFVMNTKEEINQAFQDYHATQFGGWPWPKYDQVHDRSKPRFALHADGTEEVKEG
ncbi:MAG: pirin family protein [Flavobacteriia bacterium]|nr:pirin family protein [Flavobacteriia bacterium]